jgi:hypothetical protein
VIHRTSGKGRLRILPAAVIAGVAATALAAAPGYAHTARASGTTVHVIEHAITDTEIPTGGGKDVKGNILTFNNPVFNVANRKQLGHDEGFCTRLAPKQGIWECLWTTFLKARSRSRALTTTRATASFRSRAEPGSTVTPAAR